MKSGIHAGISLAFLAMTALLSSGCATLRESVQPPSMSIVGLRMIEAGITRQHYDLRIHVENPNPVALPVRGISYRIRLGGEDFASGSTVQAFNVPAGGEAEFEISVTTDLLSTLAGLQRALARRDTALPWELGGQLQVDLPFVRAIPFSESGTVDLSRDYRY